MTAFVRRKPNESIQILLRRFRHECEKADIHKREHLHRHYIKPSDARRMKVQERERKQQRRARAERSN